MPDSDRKSVIPQNVARAIHQHLIGLKSAGVAQLPKSEASLKFPALQIPQPEDASNPATSPTTTPAPSPNLSPNEESKQPRTVGETAKPAIQKSIAGADDALFPSADGWGPAVPLEDRPAQLEIISNKVANCQSCSQLAKSRTQTVFGVGTASPQLVFFGEAPGADEDRLGEPFVGAAGQLLTKIIEAMKLTRDDVYILNTLKCRPPGNRNPKPAELRNCAGFAISQLEILQPQIICCLGSIAAKTLLNTTQSISRMRGNFYKWRGCQVLATYHPAYLLRTPSAKKQVWEDMKLILAELER